MEKEVGKRDGQVPGTQLGLLLTSSFSFAAFLERASFVHIFTSYAFL